MTHHRVQYEGQEAVINGLSENIQKLLKDQLRLESESVEASQAREEAQLGK